MKTEKLGTIEKRGLKINIFWTGKEMRLGYNGIVEKTIIEKINNEFIFVFSARMKTATGATGIKDNEIGKKAYRIYQNYSADQGWFDGIEA